MKMPILVDGKLNELAVGVVKFFNHREGWGYIVPNGKKPGEADVYFNIDGSHHVVAGEEFPEFKKGVLPLPEKDSQLVFLSKRGRQGFFASNWGYLFRFTDSVKNIEKRPVYMAVRENILGKDSQATREVFLKGLTWKQVERVHPRNLFKSKDPLISGYKTGPVTVSSIEWFKKIHPSEEWVSCEDPRMTPSEWKNPWKVTTQNGEEVFKGSLEDLVNTFDKQGDFVFEEFISEKWEKVSDPRTTSDEADKDVSVKGAVISFADILNKTNERNGNGRNNGRHLVGFEEAVSEDELLQLAGSTCGRRNGTKTLRPR